MLTLWQHITGTLTPFSGATKLLTFENVRLNVGSLSATVSTISVARPVQAATVAVNGGTAWTILILTTNAGHTIAAPTGVFVDGQLITVTIRNLSGGAAGTATWTAGAGGFRLAGAWVQGANGNQRSATFRFDATANAWYEVARNAADVPV